VSNLRHRLTDALQVAGGHIGYGVRPTARRRGLATYLLRETLGRARAMGIDEALLTCASTNQASIQTILRNGGVLVSEEFIPGRNEVVQRYRVRTARNGPMENTTGIHPEHRVNIVIGGLDDHRVQALLANHVKAARAETAPGSAHALDVTALKSPDVTFWSAWKDDTVVGVGALKRLSPTHGEIKSMHTADAQRRSGVGTAILHRIIDSAQNAGMTRLSLETGSWAYFNPARAFYQRHGFVECPPFGDYVEDANSIFMTLDFTARGPARVSPAVC
jgi:putative acetyltransferase